MCGRTIEDDADELEQHLSVGRMINLCSSAHALTEFLEQTGAKGGGLRHRAS